VRFSVISVRAEDRRTVSFAEATETIATDEPRAVPTHETGGSGSQRLQFAAFTRIVLANYQVSPTANYREILLKAVCW